MNHQAILKGADAPIKVAFSTPALMALDTMPVAERRRSEKAIRALQTSSLAPRLVTKHPVIPKCYVVRVSRDVRLFYEKTSPKTIQVLDLMSPRAIASLSGAKTEGRLDHRAA